MATYILFRVTVLFFRITPFPLIYFFSDITFLLLYYVFGYRKKVVFSNLQIAFPDKTEKEIKNIAKKYYKHLADITFESIKGYTLNKNKLLKRFKIKDPQIEVDFYEKNKNIVFVGGHLGNWEWGTRATPYLLKHEVVILYKPLRNKYINRFINNLRRKDNTRMQSIFTTGRAFHGHNKPFCVIMLSDQNPSNKDKAIWTNFFGRPTACLHGAELYAKKYDFPVVFFNIEKIKRGYYEISFDLISENPRSESKGMITKKYMNLLEEKIRQNPYNWIWSHKRWKHKYEPEKYKLV